jgi:enterochelin esterase-like enzyme
MQLRSRKEYPRGRVLLLQHESVVLGNNPWGDPSKREVAVYLPHDYSESGKPFVSLWDLAAYTNSGPGHLNWRNQGESLVERLDRLMGQSLMPSAVVVIPDCYTSLGGNQYFNSPSVGRYADYLVQELVPFLDSQLNLVSSRTGRGLFGKSSGGYGALYLAMTYPDCWGGLASLAGDVGFELVYRPEFPVAAGMLAGYGGDVHKFMRAFWRKNRPGGKDYSTMMVLAMAASYDPDPNDPENIRLPFDLRTCELIPERWSNWLSFDPLSLVSQYVDQLQSLHALIIEVGIYDQYNIQYGSRQLKDRLSSFDIDCEYSEFDGSHSAIDWRLDHVLPNLASALKTASFGSS